MDDICKGLQLLGSWILPCIKILADCQLVKPRQKTKQFWARIEYHHSAKVNKLQRVCCKMRGKWLSLLLCSAPRQIVGIETVNEVFYWSDCWWYLGLDALTNVYFRQLPGNSTRGKSRLDIFVKLRTIYAEISPDRNVILDSWSSVWDVGEDFWQISLANLLWCCQVTGNFNVFHVLDPSSAEWTTFNAIYFASVILQIILK